MNHEFEPVACRSIVIFPFEDVSGLAVEFFADGFKGGEADGFGLTGFEDGEVEEASACGFVPITLGRRILRTETAGFTVLSWIMYQLEGDRPESSQLGQPGI